MQTHSKVVGVLLSAALGGVGCASVRTPNHGVTHTGATDASNTPTVAAALVQRGYIGTPMFVKDDYRFVQATIGVTPVDLLVASDAPCDLLLDPSLHLG